MLSNILIFIIGGTFGYLAHRYRAAQLSKSSNSCSEAPTVSVPKIPSYLSDNDWEQELNLKLWSTKGARFQADKRCAHLSRLSQFSTSLLTAYVIIIGLMPYFLKNRLATDAGDFINYFSTAISIVLLAYSLIESFQEYGLQAHHFHQCGLSLAKLYNRLRQAKAMAEEEKRTELRKISEEYEDVLGRYENHESLDFEMFQTLKPGYYSLTAAHCYYIRFKYLLKVRLRHYAIMLLPPFIIIWLLYYAFTHPELVKPL